MNWHCWAPCRGQTKDDAMAIEALDAEDAAVEFAERTSDAGEYPEQVSVANDAWDPVVTTFDITTDIAVIVYAHEVE